MGLLDSFSDPNSPQGMGLLGAASQILQQSGNTRQPFGLGQAMGVGIQGYMQGSQQARAAQQQKAEQEQAMQMRAMQIEAAQREQEQQQAAMQEQARLRDYLMKSQSSIAQPSGAPQQPMQSMQPPQQQGQSGESLYESMMQEAKGLQANGFFPQAQAKMKEALTIRPKFAQDARTVMGPDGKPMLVQMADDGTVRPIQGGYGAAEKLHFGDNGQNLVGMDQFTGQVKSSLGKQQSLESLAGNAVSMRGQNMTDARAREANQVARDKADVGGKPMPATALKMQQAELDAIGTASGIQNDIARVQGQIASGKLEFGPIDNLISQGRNAAGMSNEVSRNFGSFKSTMEKMRNDSLRLNTGVQTDGDAQRAWNELFANINDQGVVSQRLEEIKNLNARAVNLRRMNVDGIRANYGRDPLDTSKYEAPAPTASTSATGQWSIKRKD